MMYGPERKRNWGRRRLSANRCCARKRGQGARPGALYRRPDDARDAARRNGSELHRAGKILALSSATALLGPIVIVTATDIPGINEIAMINHDWPCLAAEVVNHPESPLFCLRIRIAYAAEGCGGGADPV